MADRDLCEFHEENTKLLASLDTKLGTLISLISAAIILWFPVVVSGVVFLFTLNSRVTLAEKQIQVIKEQRNQDHPNKDKLL